MRPRLLVCIALAWWLSGCGDVGLRCEDPERYTDSGEIPPLQIPDDLDPPDQSEALQIPDASEVPQAADSAEETEADEARPCIESPPEFFEEGLPG